MRGLVRHAKANGPGRNHLVQNSAGSGKSNSIAWLAHHLSSLHDDADQLAEVVREMMRRGKQPNLSYFACTATPKYKTKKIFDEPGPSGESPFHLYTMRQAIEETEKYQTGFDQPLLHTMYVDKKLTGLQAVQTLSRLNHTCAGKEDTFILDFRNKPEEIFKAFKPYYEDTPTEPLTDAQHLYRLQHQIEETGLIFEQEVKAFCAVYFKPRRKETVHDHAQMNGILDQAVERFKERPEEEREEAKTLLVNFRNLYGFLSQVIPYQDSDLEQLYTYLRFLLTKLPKRDSGPGAHLEDEIELQYYRLQKISEGQIDLNTGDGHPLKGPSDVGTGQEDEKIKLSELIDILNERFGTNFTQADQLFFDQIQEEATENDTLQKAAATNTKDDFRYVFEKAFEGLVIDRMDGNEEIFGKLMSDVGFRKLAVEHMLHKVYTALKTPKVETPA